MSGVERIAVVQRDVNRSGSLARDAFLLVRELVALGCDVHVYCDPETRTGELDAVTFHDVRPLVESASRVGRAVETASFAVRATRMLRADARGEGYGLVYVNGVAAWEHDVVCVHEVVRAAQRRWSREVAGTVRVPRLRATVAPVVRPQLGVGRSIQRLQFRDGAYAGLLAVTDEVRDDLVETVGVSAERIVVVPLSFDLPAIEPGAGAAVRAKLGIAPDDALVLFVGHAFRRKGLPAAIDALGGLPASTHVVVVGDGAEDERRDADRHAGAAGVANRVHYVGTVEPAAYYGAADVFVLPTLHDVWGVPVFEAMASGVPVVTTRAAGSAAELARAGAGIVIDSAAPGELRDAVAALLADPVRRAAMGERGRHAAVPYTPRGRAERTLEACERFAAVRPYRRSQRRDGVRRIASLPAVQTMNPYQRLLYEHLRRERFELEPAARLSLRWLLARRRRVDALHVHWPQGLYRLQRGPARLRAAGSWAKLVLFALRLAAARVLGLRIVWTVHQVYPHDSRGRRLDRLAARVLGRAADLLLVHDDASRERAAEALGPRAARHLAVVPHGSYLGVYPAGRSRAAVRRELGLSADAFVFISFGEIRARKCWPSLVRAFRATTDEHMALVIAGLVRDPEVYAAMRAAVGGDPRIHLLPGFVEDEQVAELYGAADAAVAVRDDGGTSGSLVLALSLGAPVVAADFPAYRELTGGEDAGWLFRAGDELSLRDALERAASDPGEARRRGDAALERARRLRWSDVAAETARQLRRIGV